MKKHQNWKLPDYKQARKRTKNPIEYVQFTPSTSQIGADQSYYISTYGCQANEADSETLSALMESMGYQKANSADDADVILINTCGIRENARNHVLGEIGNYKRLMNKENPPVLAVCGCMVQEEGFTMELLEKYPWVSLLFGTHNLLRLPEYMERVLQGERVVEIYSKEGVVYEDVPMKRESRHKAWVNIMYGCDKFCTYCIVPYTRGKQRSRKPEAILSEIQALKNLGYKEITLLGQNVNAYGKDLEDGVSFASLLDQAADIGIDRVRFMTSHPWDFSDELIEVMAKRDNIMPFLHLPLQSGDDEILKRMGRRYTQEEYLELVRKIRKAIPDISLSTDVIVGFPGESEEAFENTLKVMEEVGFDNAYTFIYSPRPHTPAANMEDEVTLEEKKDRLNRLNKLWNDKALEKNQKELERVQEVLVDGPSKRNALRYSGYTPYGKLVNFSIEEGQKLEAGDLVNVQIDEAKTFSLNGHTF